VHVVVAWRRWSVCMSWLHGEESVAHISGFIDEILRQESGRLNSSAQKGSGRTV
jgi:hypothetical protein